MKALMKQFLVFHQITAYFLMVFSENEFQLLSGDYQLINPRHVSSIRSATECAVKCLERRYPCLYFSYMPLERVCLISGEQPAYGNRSSSITPERMYNCTTGLHGSRAVDNTTGAPETSTSVQVYNCTTGLHEAESADNTTREPETNSSCPANTTLHPTTASCLYFGTDSKLTQNAAVDECSNMSGLLASFSTDESFNWLQETREAMEGTRDSEFWVGTMFVYGRYYWIGGSAVKESRWMANEPSSDGPCVTSFTWVKDYLLNDAVCDSHKAFYICEVHKV